MNDNAINIKEYVGKKVTVRFRFMREGEQTEGEIEGELAQTCSGVWYLAEVSYISFVRWHSLNIRNDQLIIFVGDWE